MRDRPPTNIEMMNYIHARWDEHDDIVARDGCCGAAIPHGGTCPESGRMCPLYAAAERIERATFKKETL